MKRPAWTDFASVGILCALYVATAKRGLLIDAVSGFATPVWPPTGISLFALSCFGYRLWPGIALGAFLVNTSAGAPPHAALGMAAGNTLEAMLGTCLLRRAGGSPPSLDRMRSVIGLVIFAAGLSTLASATVGVTSGWLGGVIPSAAYKEAWWTWWLGDVMGDLVVAPLLFTWSSRSQLHLSSPRIAEAVALVVVLIATTWAIFGYSSTVRAPESPYLLFPLLIWAALRFGARGSVTATFIVSALAIWGTSHRLGPFARDSLHTSLLMLQAFMSVVAVTMLVLAAAGSERKRLEEELRQRAEALAEADQRKDEFLAMLAHELRNPLAPILHAIAILEQVGPPEPRLIRVRAVIARQVRHQARLLDDLLDVSRISRGKIVLHPERLDLVQLVRETAEDCRSVVEAAGLTFTLELPAAAVWVEGDPTRLAQVVSNLIQNAAKFTEPDGRVTVRLAREPGEQRAAITVHDTGIGIEAELLPHIFDTFRQADRSLDRSQGGLGLGLALVKGLVVLHGGTVKAESAGSGQGAMFTLLLPIAPAPAAREAPATEIATSTETIRILVVEDNRDTAETLCELLELSGYDVRAAGSGPAGIEAARQFQPKIVLCDLGLPGMDGYQVAAALRREPETKAVRLIAVSGYGQEDDRRRAREAGFDLHLTKPVDFAELQRLLEISMESSQA